MNKKLLTIQVLKQRITNMQQELNKLQRQPTKPKRSQSKSFSRSKDKSSSPIRNTSSNKRYKSPTFWTGNPILGNQNPYICHDNISPPKKPQRILSFTSKSPLQQKIRKQVDLNFYQSLPRQRTPQKQNNFTYESVKQQNKKNFNKANQNKIFQMFRNIPKVQKKKTYELPKKDPILNPQPPKICSKKITAPLCRSPKNMFVQNPNSNPNLYFNSTQPVTLSPKPHNNKNKSPMTKLLLCNSLQDLGEINHTSKSSKKHYNRYFKDNFQSKWNMQW